MEELDYLNFKQQRNRTKFYSWVPGLRISSTIRDRNIRIDEDFYICSSNNQKRARGIIENYAKEKLSVRNISSVILYYKCPKNKQSAFIAEGKINRFLLAVTIFYNKRADNILGLSIGDAENNTYFKIHDYSTYSNRHREIIAEVYIRRDFIEIETEDEIKQIRKIYKHLGIADIEDHKRYSPLHNSVKFYEHSYREDWTLLKTLLFFISLESLLGDKAEIAYKISLRASYLLNPEDSKKRQETFNFLKQAYSIRSSFVHGSNPEKDIRRIEKQMANNSIEYCSFHFEFIENLESIVAGCLKEILLDRQNTELFSTHDKRGEIFNYLDNLVLG